MADTKLTALSALTTLTSDDLLYVVDDPSGTPASKKAALSALGTVLMPGLLGPTISVTVAATATIGRVHIVTGTTYTITLPTAAGITGQCLGFIFGPTIALLSGTVLLDPAGGETMNGLTDRLFWAGEAVILQSNGTNWNVLDYKANPMRCSVHLGSVQSLTNNTQTTILLDTVDTDPSAMFDATSHFIGTARPGIYQITAIGAFSDNAGGAFTTNGVTNVFIRIASALDTGVTGYVTTSSYPIFEVATTAVLAAGQTIQLSMYQVTGATQGAYGAALLSSGPCILRVVEMPSW